MGMTIAEKILAAHADRDQVKPGDFLWCRVDATATTANSQLEQLYELGVTELANPDGVYVVEDHLAPPPSVVAANKVIKLRQAVKEFGLKNFWEYGRHGILHQLYPENGMIAPGDLIAMPDSHSTSGGVFNACVTNAAMDSLLCLIFGEYWFRVPESMEIRLEGTYAGVDDFIFGKDIVLKMLGTWGSDVGLYRSMEFRGPAAEAMSLSSRWTISNMGVEMGAKFAVFEADEKVDEFLEGRVDRPYERVFPDEDAQYAERLTLDVTGLEPQVACPHDPSNVKPISEVESEKIKVDQALIGSCTNARMEDFRAAAKILKGREVHPDVRLLCSPASQAIWRECLKEGLWEVFADAGANIEHSTCGPCFGGHMGVLGDGEVSISSTNRNFAGRQGSPESFVYLSNPAVVAASAVTGYITDPRKFL
jgi:3-isopropylmalate/(R)-2-methylmalate dehydratase large subunit